MRHAKTLILLLLLGGLCLAPADPVLATGYETVGVRKAHQKVVKAKKEVRRAKARLAAAKRIEADTRRFTAAYGANVGRWVWLAGDVGWPRSTLPTLFFIMKRESGGSPKALNTQGSGAAGLLQFMPGWYHGEWGYPAFDPFNPRKNLKAGVWVYRRQGWQPWGF